MLEDRYADLEWDGEGDVVEDTKTRKGRRLDVWAGCGSKLAGRFAVLRNCGMIVSGVDK